MNNKSRTGNKFKDKFEQAGITEDFLIERLKHYLDNAKPHAAPPLLKMAAAGIGAAEMFGDEMENKSKEIPLRTGAFHQIEEAQVVEVKELGAVRSES